MIEIPPGDRVYIGQSFMEREGDDLVISVLVDHLSEADSAALCAERDRLTSGLEYFLDLVDIRDFNSVALGARKYVLKQRLNAATRGYSLVGGSSHTRAITSMVFRGLRVLNPRRDFPPLRFSDTEAEARAWIAERRAAIKREKGG